MSLSITGSSRGAIGSGKAAKGANNGGARNKIPSGYKFLRNHTVGEMIEREEAARKAGDDGEAALWRACQLRRVRKSLRDIAKSVDIPYAILRRKFQGLAEIRRHIRYDDDRYRRRGSYAY